MIEEEIMIINKLGLHARAAAKLVNTAAHYGSKITLAKEGRSVDAKSIMAVMMLAASQGTQLTLTVEGPDEEQSRDALVDLIQRRFDEGE